MKKYLWGALILVVLLATASLAANAQATTRDLSGWAWSSNIGWVSFNSADSGTGTNGVGTSPVSYKVQLESDGDLTGYAWSSNVGWIKFGGLTGTPDDGDNARVYPTNGNVVGWIRACSGTVDRNCNSATRTDGWDGWIHLADEENHSTGIADGTGGVTYVVEHDIESNTDKATLKGYAWGGDVVGWLKFSPTATIDTTVTPGSDSMSLKVGNVTANSGTTPGTTVELKANASGQASASVLWSATNAFSSCGKGSTGSATIVSGWTDGGSTNSGSGSILFSNTGSATTTKSIRFTCLEDTDTVTRVVNVSVAPYSAPALACIQPSNSEVCGVEPQFIYTSGSLKLVPVCPSGTGPFNCTYVCKPGYVINGNRCTKSDLQEL